MTQEIKKPLTRSEREAAIKDKAGLVIVVVALLLAVNTYFSNKFSGAAMTNLLHASNTYGFYQSKSVKQSLAESQLADAKERGHTDLAVKIQAKIDRYESEPETGEGKKELLVKAQQFEQARDEARKHSPWLTFSGMLFQLAIVLLSASIISVSTRMYWGSWAVGGAAIILMLQGIFLLI